ncbi:MAG: GatB/YqeY domain-containing protein [Aminivibrio sp.]
MAVKTEKRISDDLLAAMKEKKELELSTLRMVKAEFQRAKTEKGRSGEFSEDEATSLVQRLIKQRREAAEQYEAVGAADRAEQELKEAAFLEKYLPEQLGDEELIRIIEETGALAKATGPADMGKVMGMVMAKVKGQADGKKVREKVSAWLESLTG